MQNSWHSNSGEKRGSKSMASSTGPMISSMSWWIALPTQSQPSLGLASPQAGETVIVYRVEGAPNTRILINPNGTVAIVGSDENMLFLNFGSRMRAEQFFAQRLRQDMPGLQMKSFEVPRSFLEELRATAVEQSRARMFPKAPQISDPTKAPDQFGLQPAQIDKLRGVIVQGSGQIHK